MRSRKSLFLVAAVLLLVPAAAFASSMRVGISAFGGYQTYSMSDVNDAISAVNADAAAAGATGSLDNISHGIGFGGGLHGWMNDHMMLALEYNRLAASSSGDFSDPSSGTTVSGEIKVPANGVTFSAAHFFPTSHKTRLGLGAGVGYYSASGKEEAVDPSGTSTSADITGHAFGFHGMGMLDSPLSPMVHLEVGAGYRYAKTSNVKEGGVEMLNADGSKAKIDWSGLMTRVGFAFYFGQASH